MLIANVAVVNTAYNFDKLFSYSVPDILADKLVSGIRVMVPFGNGSKPRIGIVFSTEYCFSTKSNFKDILEIVDNEPVLSNELLSLAIWMKDKYFCTLYDAAKIMLPSGMGLKIKNSYILNENFKDFDREKYNELQWAILQFLYSSVKSVTFEKIAKDFGIIESNKDFTALIEMGAIQKVNIASSKVKDAVSKMVRPISDFSGKLTPRQKTVYETLMDTGAASAKEICYFTGVTSSVISALSKKGAVEEFEYEVYRRPEMYLNEHENIPSTLSDKQNTVLNELIDRFESEKATVSLLFGVTGSGKTAVFLKLIEHVVSKDKSVIVMVPEISLTSQTINTFSSVFGDNIAIFHSGLSLGERYDEWKRVKRGEIKIVIGTRSSVFAPVSNLGLIVIDEEQEHTYKSESTPRYDAREVAKWRCAKNNTLCLLCSATPSVESYYMADKGRYSLHNLDYRYGDAQLPEVELIDMNEEVLLGGESLLSTSLYKMIQQNFDEGHQSILLLNRRGYHTFASCGNCSEVISCPNCSISLTYHSANNRLMCHYCGYSVKFSKKCPYCKHESISFRGAGTQRAEDEIEKAFPDARILRLDTDSVSAKFSLEKKLDDFSKGNYDIMVGTQMVAKGLNFENVTLVGVLSADQILFSDDFRNNERTFDLLTQVVGRAGRGKYKGKAVIQTYVPENPYLYLASNQDYLGFYKREIIFRKALLYPPFSDIFVVGFVGEKEIEVKTGSNIFLKKLSEAAEKEYNDIPLRVLNPSPATVKKVSNKFRYKIIIKCKNSVRLRKMLSEVLCEFSKIKEFNKIKVYADSNPYTIL